VAFSSARAIDSCPVSRAHSQALDERRHVLLGLVVVAAMNTSMLAVPMMLMLLMRHTA
jgi:hypothetical protein